MPFWAGWYSFGITNSLIPIPFGRYGWGMGLWRGEGSSSRRGGWENCGCNAKLILILPPCIDFNCTVPKMIKLHCPQIWVCSWLSNFKVHSSSLSWSPDWHKELAMWMMLMTNSHCAGPSVKTQVQSLNGKQIKGPTEPVYRRVLLILLTSCSFCGPGEWSHDCLCVKYCSLSHPLCVLLPRFIYVRQQ